jgi:hypothetical protein
MSKSGLSLCCKDYRADRGHVARVYLDDFASDGIFRRHDAGTFPRKRRRDEPRHVERGCRRR